MDIITLLKETFLRYAEIILFYLPIGVIGIWRWSVWSLRKTISLFYKAPKGTYHAVLSVITPVYNEDPDVFWRALNSWKENGVDEILAVIDYSDKKSIEVFKLFKEGFFGAKMIITKKPGKRPALADGILSSRGEILALVDSDTIWSPGIKSKLLGPFSDPEVGGLVTRQDVLKTNTLARKLFKILLDDRYLLEYPSLATVSDAILCLSGRTAVYRRMAIIDKLDKLVNEKFWGEKMISGDDKTLTTLIHKGGWKSRYLRDVVVYTPGNPSLAGFMKQKLRWTRNGLRSDSRVFFSTWLWKHHKMLAIYMLDKFISPATLLLGAVYFGVALYFGHYLAAGIIFAWWMTSRTVKIFPHLKEKPADIIILPLYVVLSFVMAVVKLYALITIDVQGWITRWNKDRLSPINFFRRVLSYGATGALILSLFFVVLSYKNNVLIFAQAEKERAAQLKEEERTNNLYAFMTPDKAKPSIEEMEKTKANLISQHKSDSYGYYVVKAGDTVATLRKNFNIPATSSIRTAKAKTVLNNGAPLVVGQQLAISVADLRIPLNRETLLFNSRFAKPPRVIYEAASNTIFVRQGGSVATLDNINQALPLANKNLLVQESPGIWILRANLYVAKNVTLLIDGPEVKHLKLKSDSSGFVWMRSQTGNILISDTKITSWDEKKSAPDSEYKTGRAYITAKSSGRMDIINSELAYLGYAGLPKRGGPFGGSYGVSWKSNNNGFRNYLLTGVALNSKFHHNYFGIYTFGATGMLIRGNEAYENIEYGFDPHDDSNNMLIENNQAHNNGNHGIIISRRCFNNAIINNISYNNRLHGIMLDRQSDNNLVQGNKTYGNVDGIAIYESNGNLVLENDVRDNVRGIRLNAGSRGNYIEKNIFLNNDRGVYIYDLSQENLLFKNEIKGNEIGITIKNASQNILIDNFKMFDNKKDGRVTADSFGNNIQ